VEPELVAPSHPWGRLCVWIAGTQIGDFDDPYCGLSPCDGGFQEKCEELNELWENKFIEFSDIEIWNFLDGLLYGYHGNIELDNDKTLEDLIILHEQQLTNYQNRKYARRYRSLVERARAAAIFCSSSSR